MSIVGLYKDCSRRMILAQITTASRGGYIVYSKSTGTFNCQGEQSIMWILTSARMEIDCSNAIPSVYDTTWSWDKCCLCQRDGIEKLYNPKHHKRFDQKTIYTIANLLTDFRETGYMPKGIKQFDINLVDDAAGIAQPMLKNNVLYHHSCRKKLSRDKL